MSALLIAAAQPTFMIHCEQRAGRMRASSKPDKPTASLRLSTKRALFGRLLRCIRPV